MISLKDAKVYLRVDTSDEDKLIKDIIQAAESLCNEVLRVENDVVEDTPVSEVAKLYAVAYLYEHREEADHGKLVLMLRNLLQSERKEVF